MLGLKLLDSMKNRIQWISSIAEICGRRTLITVLWLLDGFARLRTRSRLGVMTRRVYHSASVVK